MMLSDRTYLDLINAGEISLIPAPEAIQYQPVSVDLRLGNSIVRLPSTSFGEPRRYVTSHFRIEPGEFMLANTVEKVTLPVHIAAQVHGKSTWARRGLMVHAAGLVDPGFDGTITLELKNLSHRPIDLVSGNMVAQLSFSLVDTAVLRPYGSAGLNSHYQGQENAEPARG